MIYQLFIGLDVGKSEHHATALLSDGTIVRNNPLPQSEVQLLGLFTELTAQHGQGLLVVDQPNTIGALPVAVAQSLSLDVAYLPGLTIRRVADLHPRQAQAQADTRDCCTDR